MIFKMNNFANSVNILWKISIQDSFTLNFKIDGQWGAWATWGSCNATCGGGAQARTRKCNHPSPRFGGAPCAGLESQTQKCGTQSCPIGEQSIL